LSKRKVLILPRTPCTLGFCSQKAAHANISSAQRQQPDECTTLRALSWDACTTLRALSWDACTTLRALSWDECTTLRALSWDECTTLRALSWDACTTLRALSWDACTTLRALSWDARHNELPRNPGETILQNECRHQNTEAAKKITSSTMSSPAAC
jgi:hypothetical protein